MTLKYQLIILALLFNQVSDAEEFLPNHPRVILETTEGTIMLELDSKKAPITVRNFIELVDKKFYNRTVFHRVIPGFMIQGGGFNKDLEKKESSKTIANESGNGISNLRGTIAMARTVQPHSAGSQFFINVEDNLALNPNSNNWGYAVFGYVIDGMDIVDKISETPTSSSGRFKSDVPIVPIIITKARLEKGI
ncbi:uncharacterized protein METZ01_LOCUS350680 [marine metagenome]|uniref:peptidylprolyl isomerase n=1 Tax=marine metagenome TaxID=408172 RepID=A0A382RJM1_9ZZZZ